MHLIFIRHGDPDYANNTVTEKGRKEAELLAKRIAKWNVTDFYVSPYGRAADTLEPALKLTGRTAQTMDWLREFDVNVIDPVSKNKKSVFWDILPKDYYGEKKYSRIDSWLKTKMAKSGKVKKRYRQLCSGLDQVLCSYDYTRKEKDIPLYNCYPHLTKEEALTDTHLNPFQKNLDEKNIVFVCHLGSMFACISHLTGISPVQLWQSFFVAPSSVTVLGAQERIPGEVNFRIQQLGDVSHLTENNESPSASGFFGNVINL